jgi:hypothetical protein
MFSRVPIDALYAGLAGAGHLENSLNDRLLSYFQAQLTATSTNLNDLAAAWLADRRGAQAVTTELILLENKLRFSEQFDNAAWFKGGAIVTADTTLAPSGVITADTITDDGAGFDTLSQGVVGPLPINQWYTASAYIMRDATPQTTRFCVMRLALTTGAVVSNVDFLIDTMTGEFATVDVSSIGYSIMASVILWDSYWRAQLSVKQATRFASSLGFFPAPGAGSGLTIGNYVATTAGSIVLWGAQVQMLDHATEYLPTTTQARSIGLSDLMDGD